MARRQSLIKKKDKKVRASDAAQRIANLNFYGDEPTPPDRPMTIVEMSTALTWYNYVSAKRDLRDFIEEFLIAADRKEDVATLKRVGNGWISRSIAGMCRLITRGAVLDDEAIARHMTRIDELLKHAGSQDIQEGADDEDGEEEGNTPPAPKATVQDHLKKKLSDILGEMEGLYDDIFDGTVDITKFDLAEWYRSHDCSSVIAKKAADYWRPQVDYWDEIIAGKDKDLNEGYRYLDKEGKEAHRDFIQMIVDDSERFASNTKKIKAARAPKPKSAEKKLKFLMESYQKNSKDFNVVSVDPGKILGASELWTFNTKYKILTVFRGDGFGSKLDVARCKITGFDKNNSFSKRIGRKTEMWVDRALKENKIQLKKLMGEISGDPIKLQDRINENTILLRVV